MPYSFPTYPEDLTGTALTNRILAESRVFTTAEERIFVPSGGPFYASTMIVRDGATNQLLQPNTDYRLLHLHREGTMASGKTVVSIVHVLNSSLSSVLLSYQNIGGTFSETASTVAQLLQDNPPIAQTVWGQIIGQPPQYAPAEHLHNADELYGLGDVVSAIEHLRMAVLANDAMAIDAIYLYINNRLTDENYVTQAQLAIVSGATRVRVYPTLAHLKAGTDFTTYAAYLHVVLGEATSADQHGRLYVWNPVSLAAENVAKTIVSPDSLGMGDAGRYVSILRVEEDLQNEIVARAAAVQALTLALSNETTLRANADTAIQGDITALTTAVGLRATTTALNTEVTNRTNGDLALQANITSEAGTRAAADTALQGSITALTGVVAGKASTTSVTTEAATRLANDNTLQGNIDGEATLRGQGDAALFDFMYDHGMMPDTSSLRTLVGGTDLDTVLSSGNWYLSAVGNYSNIPMGFTHGVLHMVRNDNLNGMQIIYGAEYEPTIWFRTREQDGGPLNADWGAWRSVATTADMAALIPTPPQVGMMLVSNGVTPGSWTWAPIAAGQPISQSFIWVSANTGHVTSTLHMRTSGSGVRIGAYYYHSATPVTLDITGITTNTFRYVYAYLNGGNLALEISTTVYQRAADGAPWYHKIGDVTRAFVGMIYRDWGSSGGFIYSRSFYGDRRQFIERPPISTLLDFRQPLTAVSLTADVPIYITNDYGEIDLYTSAAAIAESDLPVIVFPEETITIEANFHWIWNTVEGSAEGRVHIVTHRSGNLNSIHVLARYALTDFAGSGDDRYMNGSFHDTVQIFGHDDVIQRLHFRALRNNTASAAVDKVLAIGAHGTVEEVLGDNRFVQVVHLPGTYPVAYNSRNRTGFRIHYDSQPEWHWMYP